MIVHSPGYISPLAVAENLPFPRRLAILGATGSIGRSALAVVAEHAENFEVAALAGGCNTALLAEQAARFRPPVLAALDADRAADLRRRLPAGYAPRILYGPRGYETVAALPEADMVLSAIVGAAGLPPTMAAARAGKAIALANKESLVLAGDLIRQTCHVSGAAILPVDSEHNALFQALGGQGLRDLPDAESLILTASGGPFRDLAIEDLERVTPAEAISHPNWSMGKKISVDSATLMNKGLEVIEACRLFGLAPERIKVVVHRQSVVHSLAQFRDGSLLAHLGPPDMRVAISSCLAYPERLALSVRRIELTCLGRLDFESPREDAFPCLALARQALMAGPSHTVVLNAANEIAVDLFLQKRLSFTGVARLIDTVLQGHPGQPIPDLETILELDRATRQESLAAAQTV